MTTISTVALAVGATAAVAGSVSSFSQAAKQKKKQDKAEAEADKAMKEARKRLDVNVMESLSIQKEPYELAREAALVAGTQGLQAGVEGETRGAAATAGRVFMGQQGAQSQIRAAMGQELTDINRAVVAEEGRLKDLGMGLELEVAAGAQQAAADAEKARAAAISQGFEGITNAASMAYQAAPLYGDLRSERGARDFSRELRGYDLTQGQIDMYNRSRQGGSSRREAFDAFGIGDYRSGIQSDALGGSTFDSSFGGGFRSGGLTQQELNELRRQSHLLNKAGI